MFSLLYLFTMASKRAKLCGDHEVEKKVSKIEKDEVCKTEEFSLHPSQHPLLNPVVLDNLFQYLDVKNLFNCRRVCKNWNCVAAKALKRRKVQIEFYTVKDFENFCSAVQTTSLTQFPFTNYKLHWETVKSANNTKILQCFETCKDILEELHLPLDYEYDDVEDKLTVIPGIALPLMVNLNSFTLDMQHAVTELFDDLEGDSADTWSKRFLTLLFSSMPNLTSFTLINRIVGRVRDVLPHTRCISEFLSHLVKLNRLQSLQLVGLISDSNLTLMKQLHLQSLKLDFCDSHVSTQVFTEFLSSQSQTLECLEINESDDFKRRLVIKFPQMKALKKLNITLTSSEDDNFIVISYDKIFPRLEKFIYNRIENDCSSTWYCKPCLTVTEANIYTKKLPSPWVVYNMTRSFSSLKRLEIFCARYCQHVFRYLDKLENLTLLGCHLYQELEFLLTGMRYTEDLKAWDTPFEDRVRPSVGLLHKLKNLTLAGQTAPKHGSDIPRLDITDFTGYSVFQKMHSLKILQVGPCKITEQCYKDLTKQFIIIPLHKDINKSNISNPRMN